MDGGRFDMWAKHLAGRISRRRAVGAVGVAGAGAIFGPPEIPDAISAQSTRLVTCSWRIEAKVSSGPSVGQRIDGVLEVRIDRTGDIARASLTLDSEETPPPVLVGEGTANGRSIDLHLSGLPCVTLAFLGVGAGEMRTCPGRIAGTFQGPELDDVGGWRTHPDGWCAEGEVFDTAACACVAEAACAEVACTDGTIWEAATCSCVAEAACADQPCGAAEYWDPETCACISTRTGEPCAGVVCGDGRVVDEETCACACPPTTCYDPHLVFDEATCECVCDPAPCGEGYLRDPGTCKCYCASTSCPPGTYHDPDWCTCVCGEGRTYCGGACVNLSTNPNNCGACGTVCTGTRPTCKAGACIRI